MTLLLLFKEKENSIFVKTQASFDALKTIDRHVISPLNQSLFNHAAVGLGSLPVPVCLPVEAETLLLE